jgi:hypothetical protein
MWLLHFIPDEWIRLFIHALTALGAILYFTSGFFYAITKRWLAGIPQAAFAVKMIGGILFVIGVFFEGGYGVEMTWRAKVAEMEVKVAQAETASAQLNQRLAESEATQQNLQTRLTQRLASRIAEQKTTINQACRLDPAAISLYNEIIKGRQNGDNK